MDKKAIAERLRALASDDKKRSKAARLRDVIDDVEAALLAGVPRSAVIEELAKQGLQMSLATFETTLKRIRQKRSKQKITKSETVIPESVEPKRIGENEEADIRNDAVTSSHNPAELDKIIASKPDLIALAKLAKRKKQ
jgi:hypothetical protein